MVTADCLDISHWAGTLNLLQMPLAFQCANETFAERETHQPKSHSKRSSKPPGPYPSPWDPTDFLQTRATCKDTSLLKGCSERAPPSSEPSSESEHHSVCRNLNYKDVASVCFPCRLSSCQLVDDQTFQLSLNSGCS